MDKGVVSKIAFKTIKGTILLPWAALIIGCGLFMFPFILIITVVVSTSFEQWGKELRDFYDDFVFRATGFPSLFD